MKHPFPLLPASLFLLASCSRPPVPIRLQWLTMGTVAAVQSATPADAPQARAITQDVFDAIDRELSSWRPDSALAAVNRAAGTGRPTPVPPDFAAVFRAALALCAESDGAFNPLVGPVMHAWGFNGAAPQPARPSDAELAAALALADWRSLSPRSIALPAADMQLDFGAIAKGYAVDLAWARLKAAGHTNLLVDLGGNLRALGEAAPGRGGWRTGVRNPFVANALVGQFLMRDGEAAATSGNYERFVEIGGLRYAHIMDGRTGHPVTGMAGVTVIAPDATTADGLSTTLFILGPQRGADLLRNHPGCEALWIPDAPHALNVLATPGFAARLTPIGNTPYRLTVLPAE